MYPIILPTIAPLAQHRLSLTVGAAAPSARCLVATAATRSRAYKEAKDSRGCNS